MLAAGGKVRLLTLNIDDYPGILGQLGIKSIPAVTAFTKGHPVDGFVGNLPEEQIKRLLERLVGPLKSLLEEQFDQALELEEQGDVVGAIGIYAGILQNEPHNTLAIAALVRIYAEIADIATAEGDLELLHTKSTDDPVLASAKAAVVLRKQADTVGNTFALEQKIDSNPDDHQSRFNLALVLNAIGKREESVDQLLEIVKRERRWNEAAAHKKVLTMFETWGLMDKATIAGRRKLSVVLFA